MNDLFYILLTEIIISAILLTILIITIIIEKRYTTLFYQTILNFVLISFLHSLSFIINWKDEGQLTSVDSLCNVQSFIMIASQFSQVFWMSLISVIFYSSMKKNNSKEEKPWKIAVYFAIGTVIPVIITLIYYFVSWTGIGLNYCWVSASIAPGILIYVIIWVSICFNFYLTFRIMLTLNKMQCANEEEKNNVKKSGLKMLFYPAAQAVMYSVPTIYYIYFILTGDKAMVNGLFGQFSMCLLCLQGIAFPIIYGYNAEIIKGIRYCCIGQSYEEQNSIYEEIATIELNNSDFSEVLDA